MSNLPTSRRRFLQLIAGAGVAARAVSEAVGQESPLPDAAGNIGSANRSPGGASSPSPGAASSSPAAIGDSALHLEFDSRLRARAWHAREGGKKIPLTPWRETDYLLLADGHRIEHFALRHVDREPVDGPHGRGTRLILTGVAPLPTGVAPLRTGAAPLPGKDPSTEAPAIEKRVSIELYERYPGFAFYQVTYRNLSQQPLALRGWRSADLQLLTAKKDESTTATKDESLTATKDESSGATKDESSAATKHELGEPSFWSYCGSTHADRRDWVQPVRPGFSQDNFMGMTASDYGGGTPVVDVWRRDCGLAVGHLETTPRLVSLPVTHTERGARLAIACDHARMLTLSQPLPTPQLFIALHTGDYFNTLVAYRRIMAERGLVSPPPPDSAYQGIWCAWGYERNCTVQLIEDTLPKVKDLGLRWAVIDDGWQTNVGDWKPHPDKFPRGDADMQSLVQKIRADALLPRLWVTPLAAAPNSDLLHDHSDMLLLDKDGAPQTVSWWNSFYLCPAYEKTVTYTQALVRRFIGQWGFAGLKVDGQHLNGVAPCYNPAHRHARPEESVEKLQDFLHAMYVTAREIDPEVVMELCPCGTSYSFYNFASMNQAPASDPESSWQVRHKGKTLKALMGPSAAFAGDHVELSDGGDDFASTVGIGAIVSTKFTWPVDPKPKDSFMLTPQREALWRKWIALYNERLLPQGTYRGELYDIGFDKPETHVVEKAGRVYYGLFARGWRGAVVLRGLAPGRYRMRDYFHGRELGEVVAPAAPLQVEFDRFLLLEAIPV